MEKERIHTVILQHLNVSKNIEEWVLCNFASQPCYFIEAQKDFFEILRETFETGACKKSLGSINGWIPKVPRFVFLKLCYLH